MESFGSFFDDEWENLTTMFAGGQDSGQFSGNGLFSGENDQGFNLDTPSIVSPNNANSSFIDDPSLCYASENINPNFDHYFSQEVGNSNFQFCPSNIIPLPSRNEHDYESVDLFTMDEHNNNFSLLAQVFSDDSMEEILCLRQDMVVEKGNMDNSIGLVHTPLKRKIEMPELPNALEEEVKFEKSDKKTIKKNRVSRDNKNKKKGQPKKNQKVMDAIVNDNGTDPEDTNSNSNNNNNNKRDKNAQSSSYCSSEDDSNTCQDLNGGAIKTRASRGAATDPQSLYARKRRERINERLRILQNLVPNGTKVDISTMLEEAVHYVKFLQLQIKLLSSDEMWMYAPIAYNGMDMGLYQKISPTLQ